MTATTSANSTWYIVRSRPSAENRAGEEILALGQTVYVPQFRKEFRHHRSKRKVSKFLPLLRGYLFVMASPNWTRILDCDSVDQVLSSRNANGVNSPIPIADSIVHSIRTAQDAGKFDTLVGGNVSAGDQLKINDGPFLGYQGVVESVTDENVVMLITMLSREVKAHVPLAKLGRTG